MTNLLVSFVAGFIGGLIGTAVVIVYLSYKENRNE